MEYSYSKYISSLEVIIEIENTLIPKSGIEYTNLLVQLLAKKLELKWAFIGKFNDQKTCEIISLWDGHKIKSNIFYELIGTPCFKVLENKNLFKCANNLISFFPDDHLAKSWGVECYTGAPILDSNQKVVGVLVVMDNKPFNLNLPLNLDSILVYFSNRVEPLLKNNLSNKKFPLNENNIFNGLQPIVNAMDDNLKKYLESDLKVNANDSVIWHYVIDKDAIVFSDHWLEKLGYKFFNSQLTFSEWKQLVDLDYQKSWEVNFLSYINGSTSFYKDKFKIRKNDGIFLNVCSEVKIVDRDKTGKAKEIIGFLKSSDFHTNEENELERIKLINKGILNSAGEGIFGIDLHEVITFANPTAQNLLGCDSEELIGRSQNDLIVNENIASKFQSPFYLALQEGKTISGSDTLFLKKDGSSFPVEYTVSPIFNYKNLEGAVVVFRDISESRKLLDKIKVTQIAIEATQTGIWDYNVSTGKVTYSPEWFTMLGYKPNQFPPSYETWVKILHPDNRDMATQILSQYVKGEIPDYKIEFRLKCNDGNYLWIYSEGIITERLKNGKPKRVIGIHIDIEDKKKVNQLELQMVNNDKLIAIGQIAAYLSHELNNPLQGIIGGIATIDSLLTKDSTPTSKTISKINKMMRSEIIRVGDLVKKMTQHYLPSKNKIEEVDINKLIEDALFFVSYQKIVKNFRIEKNYFKTKEKLLVVPDQLKQVFVNIFKNSIENSKLHGLTIKITTEITDVKMVKIRVEDDGLGMTKEALRKVLIPFTSNKPDGSGLGMYISSQIIKNHSGNLNIESELNKGTTVEISLRHE